MSVKETGKNTNEARAWTESKMEGKVQAELTPVFNLTLGMSRDDKELYVHFRCLCFEVYSSIRVDTQNYQL